MARGVKVVINDDGIRAFLAQNKDVRDLLISTGQAVAAEAQSTASDAEGGPGGRLDGYAAAGFSVEWEGRAKRPRVNVRSNADGEMATRVHLASQKRNGVGHLRAALYSQTSRGG